MTLFALLLSVCVSAFFNNSAYSGQRISRLLPPDVPKSHERTEFIKRVFKENTMAYSKLNKTKLYFNDNDLLWEEDPKAWHQAMARIIDHVFVSVADLKDFALSAKKAGVSVLMLVKVQKTKDCPGGWYGGLQLCDHINGEYPADEGSLSEWQAMVEEIKPMRLMWWTNMDYWSVQGPVWNTALNDRNSEENKYFSWGAGNDDQCFGSNPNGAQGSWGSDGAWSGWQSALATYGSETYVDYLVDAMANSWTKNLAVDGFCIDCGGGCYNPNGNCKHGMMQTPNGDAMTAWSKIVDRVQQMQPKAIFSAEDFTNWEGVMQTHSQIAGQGYQSYHYDLQGAVYDGDVSNIENIVANSGAEAAVLLCYLNPFYDGQQPGGCPSMYFRDMTATMGSIKQYRMWVALEAGAGVVSQHDYDDGNGMWWAVQNDPADHYSDDDSLLWAFTQYRALNRLALRTNLKVTSGHGVVAWLKHDSMGPDGDAAILIYNPGYAQSVTIDLSILPSSLTDGSVTPTNIMPANTATMICYKKLEGGIPTDEGNEVGQTTGGSLSDCEASCNLNANCRSLTYTTNWGAQCFLKDKELSPTTPVTPNSDYVSYYQVKCEPGEYMETQGNCRGGPAWPSGDSWDCNYGRLDEAGCQAACDAKDGCGAFDRPDTAGADECCLFRPGSTGNGDAGRVCFAKTEAQKLEEDIPPLTRSYTIQMDDLDIKALSGFTLGVFAPRQGKKHFCQPSDGYTKNMYGVSLQSCFLDCYSDSKCQNVFVDYTDVPYYGAAPTVNCVLLGEVPDPSSACTSGEGTLIKKMMNGRLRR